MPNVLDKREIQTIFETAKDILSTGLLTDVLAQMPEYRYKPAGKKRLASYVLPERTDSQKALLQKYLPAQCRY